MTGVGGTIARRGLSAAVAASVLALVVSGQSLAASWSPPVDLGGSYAGDLIVLGESRAVLIYARQDPDDDWSVTTLLRRTRDGGATWSAPRDLGRGALAVDGGGGIVDLVRVRGSRVTYARSTDAGATFGRARALADAGDVRSIDVARGADGVVAVIWRPMRGPTFVRVSTDGGESFGAVGTVTSAPGVRSPSVAVGDGVIYVVYENPQYFPGYESHMKVRRSTDYGSTWGRPTPISTDAEFDRITAEGKRAYIAYTEWVYDPDEVTARFTTVQYRATTNSGATWSAPRQLSPPSWDAIARSIALRDGVLHAVFGRCTPTWDTCDDERVIYRRSVDGVSWSDPERVSPNPPGFFDTHEAVVDVIGGRVVVAYTGHAPGDYSVFVRLRD